MPYVYSHVIITGASSGLGAQLARLYAGRCKNMTLLGRDQARLAAVQQVCAYADTAVVPVLCDVTDPIAIEAAILAADCRAPVDLIIANAGIGGRAALAPPFGETGVFARHIFATNTLGVVNTITPLLQRMVERHSGSIAIIGSLAGREGLPNSPAYSASKAAVAVYAHGLRRLLRRSGVHVTLVSPGFIHTPMSASLPFATPFAWTAERAAARIVRGIDAGVAEIVFPWTLHLATRCLLLLPLPIVDFILRHTAQETDHR